MIRSEYILTLLKIPKFGRRTVASIITDLKFEPQNLFELLDCIVLGSQRNKRIKVPGITEIESANQKALHILHKSNSAGIKTLSPGCDNYPDKLLNILDPPVILFAKGDIKTLNLKKNIAIIGTRKPTEYGQKCGEAISKHFVNNDFVVTSGLAKGCDESAHRGCVEESGRSIAILGHGLHMIYPAQNKGLAEKIIETGGCLLSEYELGVDPRPNFFIERDRLQSGLALGVIVIETGVKGGTMHAVRSCMVDNKPLACLKHPEKFLNEPTVHGNSMLISDEGAFPIAEKADVDCFIQILLKNRDMQVKQTENQKPYEQLSLFPQT